MNPGEREGARVVIADVLFNGESMTDGAFAGHAAAERRVPPGVAAHALVQGLRWPVPYLYISVPKTGSRSLLSVLVER